MTSYSLHYYLFPKHCSKMGVARVETFIAESVSKFAFGGKHPMRMNYRKDFGIKLRQLREGNDLTQEKLRKELEEKGYEILHISTISRWENGSRIPKAEIVEALEDILGANRGVLLRAARYLVEQSPEQPVSSQIDPIIVKRREEHFTDLASVAKTLLTNGLDSVSPHLWGANRSRQVTYLLRNENAASGCDEITKEQLASRLDDNIAPAIRQHGDWFFRNCFVPHLKSELPEELNTELLFHIVEKHPFKLIETLRMLAARKIFKGTCPVCKDW
jgi:transcriptional regulator with XRE-family HTH domain